MSALTAPPVPSPWGYSVPTDEGFRAFVPLPAPRSLELGASTRALLDRTTFELGALAGVARHHPDASVLAALVMRREALAGATRADQRPRLIQLAAHLAGIPGEPEPGVREAADGLAAHRLAVERVDATGLSPALLAEMHAALLAERPAVRPGRVRETQTWVGGHSGALAEYVPPPPQEVGTLLHDLQRFADEDDLPPLVQAAVVLAQLQVIRPFVEGNGRLARLAAGLVLRRRGTLPMPLLALSPTLSRRREEQELRLCEVRLRGDWEGWVRFFLSVVGAEAASTGEALGALTDLRREQRAVLAEGRTPAAATALCARLPELLVMTSATVARSLAVPIDAARAALAALREHGLVVEVAAASRAKVYAAESALEALAGEG